ncbi:beta-ketoacyl-ACP synthase 3 [Streptomyces sp. CdTB01]|uniref:beta-ketoacyl-ACP synthase 3 n=1 Tax=Streptomyces sp. CdTB01 TaxID=1725411 RepID=UPI00073AA1C9|nr:beta-ketoacyl-ACP synthase 3 [Streptomyces sp. CdTB01]ALV34963.1 hypothetical protein AS200_25130 [Streptomyces sp. CdTB01]
MSGAAMVGLGVFRPRRVVGNEEICRVLDSTPEWIVRRTGISTRRFAQADETLVEMAATAGQKAMADAGVSPAEVDRVFVATMSHVSDDPVDLPSAVAERMGVRAPAVQVSAACAGFAVALRMAADAVTTARARTALVIGVERMSDLLDLTDRSTAFIFSDGAGAVLVAASSRSEIGPAVMGGEPSLAEAITVRRRPELPDRGPVIRMQGATVYRWALSELPGVVERILRGAGLAPGDVDVFLPHQANIRIIDAVAQSAGFGGAVVARDIVDQANTSAASIPLAMERMRSSGQAKRGDLALLLGFGAGLSYAGLLATLP